MKRRREDSTVEQAPLYIRWAPVGAAYAIELKLDLVSNLLGEVARAERANVETGGVLIGSFSNGQGPPTLCVEEIAFLSRRGTNGSAYIMGPGEQLRLQAIRSQARAQGYMALGMFRTHLRAGLLTPTLADRGIVASEFPQSVCALLLIRGRQPYSGVFFVAKDGHLPDEATVREFRLDEDEFNALPEIYRDQGLLPAEAAIEKSRPFVYGLLRVTLVVVLALFAWGLLTGRIGGRRSSDNQLGLALSASGGLLKISWDHSAGVMSKAQGATLEIQDGSARSETKIGVDELRLGSVEYQPATPHIKVTLALDAPGNHSQSADWTARE